MYHNTEKMSNEPIFKICIGLCILKATIVLKEIQKIWLSTADFQNLWLSTKCINLTIVDFELKYFY